MSCDRLPVSRCQVVLLCSMSDGVWPGALSKGTAVHVFQKYVQMRSLRKIRKRGICAWNCKHRADVEERVDCCKSSYSSEEVESKSHECQRNILEAVKVTSLEASAG